MGYVTLRGITSASSFQNEEEGVWEGLLERGCNVQVTRRAEVIVPLQIYCHWTWCKCNYLSVCIKASLTEDSAGPR